MTRTINSKWKQLGRALVCFALVLCFTLNLSPLRVHASATATTATVSGIVAISAILGGLGVSPASDKTDYNNLVNNVYNYLRSAGKIALDGTIALSVFNSKTYISTELIALVRQYMIDTAILVIKHIQLGSNIIANQYYHVSASERDRLVEAQGFKHIVVIDSTANYYGIYIVVSDAPISSFLEGGYTVYTSNNGNMLGSSRGGPFTSTSRVISAAGSTAVVKSFVCSGVNTVESSLSLSYGKIDISATTIAEGYGEWASGAIEGEDEEGKTHPYWPIGVGATYNETMNKTQEEIWTGADSIAGAIPGAGTDADTGTISIPGINSLVHFFTGTAIVESPLTAIQFGALFDLFPFNIPKGIYDTINFWNASAAPPVISIPLPNVTRGGVDVDTYDLDFADIPGMNTLAALIRGGELILFAIGLLMITRKVTKW